MSFFDRFVNKTIVKNRDGSEHIREDFNVIKMIVELGIAFILIIMLFALQPFKSVETGTRGVITQFGAIKGIEPEGFLFVPPWQRLTAFSIRAEQADVEKAEGGTKDTQPVHESLTVRYAISEDKVAEVFEKYSHDGDLSNYIQTATIEVFKAVTSHYTAPELISNRTLMSKEIYDALSAKVAIYGAHIISIDVRDFGFSESYMTAINAKTTQEQLKLAADNEFFTVQSKQRQVVAVAEAQRDATKAAADATAYTKFIIAKSQADAIKAQGTALSEHSNVLELRRIEVEMARAEASKNWDGKLPVNMYGSAPVPFMNLGAPGSTN